ncbi:MAG TPA: BamA/TamA family outer membrane protein [Ferruginibacter sp.]|nr:BamA/TamA family outer membrane protein [Ferruginibacter sp.]HRO05318.1 BamA/TamA family outer membrane protein [Ferruginibacter sp.]HRO96082.1 BamA/TamA family outer membrane protein [Ferruginibacter sp.]HRP48584.1 BamA/TamA family outer membrane protein [Ferruginibacter sp.]
MRLSRFILFLLLLSSFFASCTIIRKAPKGKPYVVKNIIEVKGGDFTKVEKSNVISRLTNQLEDSMQVKQKQSFLIFNTIRRPPVYNALYAATSAQNMEASMFHLGYYNAEVKFNADTVNRKVKVKYTVEAGNPTRIDTLRYRLQVPELQQLAEKNVNRTLLKKNTPISKLGVQTEIARLVDTFRNNGYYKITAAELKLLGDTSIAALTTITDDPFEQLELLAQAEAQRDSPVIRLAFILNKPDDTTRIDKYYINKITILPDYIPGDVLDDPTMFEKIHQGVIIRYRQNLFAPAFLVRNLQMKSGNVYRQIDYYRTIANFSKAAVWETVNIRLIETPGESNKLDVVVELMASKKFGFEASIETSYSANSNTNNALAGNLFGISGNLSLSNRNIRKEGIKMTHRLRAGIELNNNNRQKDARLVNSQELSYSNNISIPRLITPIKSLNNKYFEASETFINFYAALNNRLDLFNTQTFNLNYGWGYIDKRNLRWTFKPINIEFNYLFNQTDSFTRILDSIPFLRYSYNTAFIAGMSAGVSHTYKYKRSARAVSRERFIRLNIEESGLTWGAIPIANKYKRRYIKTDFEYKYTVNYENTALVARVFTGVGVSFGKDTTLPFFKQYFGGGSNSMRGWPIRGIGRGAQQLVPFGQNIFNDRTADLQLEANLEYRYIIARIIPNSLTLRGALFLDAGNIWNLRNSNPSGGVDSAQFRFKNLYKELGVSAGTGFRLDFNYFVLRFDMGFRIKRPELSHRRAGWNIPDIGFDDVFSKLFGRKEENRKWRYENFNFTIGISYPF